MDGDGTTSPYHGYFLSCVIQYSVVDVGAVPNRALTAYRRLPRSAIVGTSNSGFAIRRKRAAAQQTPGERDLRDDVQLVLDDVERPPVEQDTVAVGDALTAGECVSFAAPVGATAKSFPVPD